MLRRLLPASLVVLILAAVPAQVSIPVEISPLQPVPAPSGAVDGAYNADDDEFLAVFRHIDPANPGYTGIIAQRISGTTGALLGDPVVVQDYYSHHAQGISVCYAPMPAGRYLITYSYLSSTGGRPWRNNKGVFLERGGARLGGPIDVFAAGWDLNGQPIPRMRTTYDGARFFVVSDAGASAFISPDRTYGGGPEIATEGGAHASIAFLPLDGQHGVHLAAYIGAAWGGQPTAIRCRLVTPSGAVGAPRTVSVSGDSETEPVVAADPTSREWLVAWKSRVDGVDRIAFRRIDQAGFPIGTGPVLLPAEPGGDDLALSASRFPPTGEVRIHWQRHVMTFSPPSAPPYPKVMEARIRAGSDELLQAPASISSGSTAALVPAGVAGSMEGGSLCLWLNVSPALQHLGIAGRLEWAPLVTPTPSPSPKVDPSSVEGGAGTSSCSGSAAATSAGGVLILLAVLVRARRLAKRN